MNLNVSSIRNRLRKLEQYIGELEKHRKLTQNQFRDDFTAQLAVERAFQAGIECCSDIASHVVSVFKLGHPNEQRDLYTLLTKAGYLTEQFGEAMGEMSAFRNRIVHMYMEIDITRLYQYLQEDVDYLKRFREIADAIIDAEESNEK